LEKEGRMVERNLALKTPKKGKQEIKSASCEEKKT
jgi:hypothetical protein